MAASKLNKILMVDDHEDLNLAYQTILESRGYSTETASSGQKALHLLNTGFSPDFIFIDFRMPKMNGLELVQEIKKQFPKIHLDQMIILTSFSTDAPDLNSVKDEGVRVFEKPSDVDEFVSFVNQISGSNSTPTV